MPYVIVVCEAKLLGIGPTCYGDEFTKLDIVKVLGGARRSGWQQRPGFYVTDRPPCWVLNRLEDLGYSAMGTMQHVAGDIIWTTHKNKPPFQPQPHFGPHLQPFFGPPPLLEQPCSPQQEQSRSGRSSPSPRPSRPAPY